MFWRFQKTIYLCTRFPKEMLLERVSEKVLKNFRKKFRKFWRFKKMIYLCTTFRSEKRTEQNKTRNVLHSNIRTAFFEVIEQLNSFSTLFGE